MPGRGGSERAGRDAECSDSRDSRVQSRFQVTAEVTTVDSRFNIKRRCSKIDASSRWIEQAASYQNRTFDKRLEIE